MNLQHKGSVYGLLTVPAAVEEDFLFSGYLEMYIKIMSIYSRHEQAPGWFTYVNTFYVGPSLAVFLK